MITPKNEDQAVHIGGMGGQCSKIYIFSWGTSFSIIQNKNARNNRPLTGSSFQLPPRSVLHRYRPDQISSSTFSWFLKKKKPSSDSFPRFWVIFFLQKILFGDADLSAGTLASCFSWILVPEEYSSSKYWWLRNVKVPKIAAKEKSQKCEIKFALTQGRSFHHNHNCRCCWESILFRVLWGKQHLEWNWMKMRTTSSVTVPLFEFL